jgi:hypothetical protein
MAFDLESWRHLIRNVQPLAIRGFTITDYLNRSDTSLAAEPLTLAAWWNSDDFSANGAAIALADNGGFGGYYLRIATSSVQGTKTPDLGGPSNASATHGAIANTWRGSVVHFEDDVNRLANFGRKRNVSVGTSTTSIADPTPDAQTVGARINASVTEPYLGALSLPTIWDVLLTTKERSDYVGGVHPGFIQPNHIVRAWWQYPGFPMGFDFSTAAARLSVVGSNLTLVSGPPIILAPRRLVTGWRKGAAGGRIWKLVGPGGGLVGEGRGLVA